MRGLLIAALMILTACPAVAQSRIKDITTVRGIRANQLVGYGLVFGLNGTGDSLRNAPFTDQAIQSMMERMGINIRNSNPRTRNIAAVMVSSELPAFSASGTRIDVTVSSIGDASSLQGGTLVLTPLNGPDGKVYAVAQGPIAVSGFASKGKAESLTQGVPTTGRIPSGGLVEREVATSFEQDGSIVLELRNADFSTAARVSDAINSYTRQSFGRALAHETDSRTIWVKRPPDVAAARFMAAVGELPVNPDTAARIVIDEKTGTIVMGRDVRISPVAVTQGNITVRITEADAVSQPAPFSDGRTQVVPRTIVKSREEKGKFAMIGGGNLDALVKGLNAMGLKPIDVIAILQAIKTTGAIQAELVVQ